jgi:hypothetical protein
VKTRSHASLDHILAGSKSTSFRRLNAHLFAGAAVGGPSGSVGQSDAVRIGGNSNCGTETSPARVGKSRSRGARSARGPVLRICLVVFRRGGHEIDDDNMRSGAKFLRDAIAGWFGLDDSERTIAWEYAQAQTRGRPGVAVKIELIPPTGR